VRPPEEAVEGIADLQLVLVSRWSGLIKDEGSADCARGAGEIDDWRWPTESVGPRSLTLRRRLGRDSMKSASDFANGVSRCRGRCWSAEGTLFDGAVKRRVLKNDAKQAAEVLEIDFRMSMPRADWTALNVIEARRREMSVVLPARVADDGEGLAGLDAERDVAENPIIFAGIGMGDS